MKRLLSVCVGVAVIAVAFSVARSQSQDQQKEWMKLTAANENHQRLAGLVGKWNDILRMPAGENAPWMEGKGTTEFRVVMGGRFLIEETCTEMEGRSFEWMGIHGYDNAKKQYTSAWIDNLGTNIDQLQGQWDPNTKTLTYRGEVDEGGSGKTKVKWMIKLEGKDDFSVEMYQQDPDGREQKVLELKGTRA